MPVPERLQLPAAADDLVREMCDLCDEIERTLEQNGDVAPLLAKWHSHATRQCDPAEFASYWKSIDKETFVRDALNPVPELDPNLQYGEASAVLKCVLEGELSEAEEGYYLHWLEAQFPRSNVMDLIYWPDEWFGDAALFREPNGAFKPDAELSSDQILAYAMARSSRALPGAPIGVAMPFPVPTESPG